MRIPALKIFFLVVIVFLCQYFGEAKAQNKTFEKCRYILVDLPSGGYKIITNCDGNESEEVICPCGKKPDGDCKECPDLVVISEQTDVIASEKDFWKLIKIIDQLNLTSMSVNQKILEKQNELTQLMKTESELQASVKTANQLMFKIFLSLSRGNIKKGK